VEGFRVLGLARVGLVLEEKAVSLKTAVDGSPGELASLVVYTRCDNWARLKGHVGLPLKESNLDSSLYGQRIPFDGECNACWQDLVATWSGEGIEVFLSNNSGGKGQNGGGNERELHGGMNDKIRNVLNECGISEDINYTSKEVVNVRE